MEIVEDVADGENPPPTVTPGAGIHHKLVYYDLETTGLCDKINGTRKNGHVPEMISLGWCTDADNEGKVVEGEVVVVPSTDVEGKASEINKYTVKTVDGQRVLLHQDKVLSIDHDKGVYPREQIRVALKRFVDALAALTPDFHPEGRLGTPEGRGVVLVAHSGRDFDERVLRKALHEAKISLPRNVVGFYDSLFYAKMLTVETDGRRILERPIDNDGLMEMGKDMNAYTLGDGSILEMGPFTMLSNASGNHEGRIVKDNTAQYLCSTQGQRTEYSLQPTLKGNPIGDPIQILSTHLTTGAVKSIGCTLDDLCRDLCGREKRVIHTALEDARQLRDVFNALSQQAGQAPTLADGWYIPNETDGGEFRLAYDSRDIFEATLKRGVDTGLW